MQPNFENLPAEIHANIASFLDRDSTLSLAQTNQQIRDTVLTSQGSRLVEAFVDEFTTLRQATHDMNLVREDYVEGTEVPKRRRTTTQEADEGDRDAAIAKKAEHEAQSFSAQVLSAVFNFDNDGKIQPDSQLSYLQKYIEVFLREYNQKPSYAQFTQLSSKIAEYRSLIRTRQEERDTDTAIANSLRPLRRR